MNSSQARVPASLAGFGCVGVVESARGPRGPFCSPSSRPPGERSPWSPTHSHTEYRPELFDWPKKSDSLPGAVSFEPPPSAEHGLGTCPTCLPHVLTPILGRRVLCRAAPGATSCAGWQGEGWGPGDSRNQTMYCKDRRGKPLGQEGLIERKALVQSSRGRSVNRVRSDEGVAWPVQGQIGLGTGPGEGQAGAAGCG